MILFKKTLRSMWGNKSAYIACIILIMLGVALYVGMGISSQQLNYAQHQYYRENRMADVFAKVQSIPSSAKSILLDIEGIREMELRLVHDARVVIEDNDKIITMRLVSVDPVAQAPINRINIESGGFYNENDILIAPDFLQMHGLSIGDTINIVINARETAFNICGTASSPEYVYMVKDITEMLPDPEAFAVAFMPVENLAGLLNRQNQFNDLVFMLDTGYEFDDVKTALEDALYKYGLTELHDRDGQVSYSMLKAEVESTMMMSTSIPFVFVFMAIIVLYLMLKRVIEQDRTQIGTLKAFGYSDRQVLLHYLLYGILTGLAGAFLGCVAGYLLSDFISLVFDDFFKLPDFQMDTKWVYVLNGVLMGAAGGTAGALMGTASVLKLTPSEAMRPAAPKLVKKDIMKILPFLSYVFNAKGSMAVRSIGRSKLRSLFIVVGIMFSFAMLAFMASYSTMVDDMLLNQYTKVQLYDGRVSLNTPVRTAQGVSAVLDIQGVTDAEGIMEIPVELSFRHRRQGIVITGITNQSDLYKIYDNDRRMHVDTPMEGVILTNMIADELEAAKGDIITITSPLLKEDVDILVMDVVGQNLGSSCYMEIGALGRLFHMEDFVTSVVFNTEDIAYIKDYLKEGSNVGILEDVQSTYKNYAELMGTYGALMVILEVMAIIIAFAIIYNTSTISLSERKREYATLRVLGMHIKEVGEIMAFEYWLLLIGGIALGIPCTYLLKMTLAASMEMEMYTFPTYTPPAAFLRAGIGCMAAVMISNRSCRKNIGGFDMVEVLKERE